jgi:hypothetical protein
LHNANHSVLVSSPPPSHSDSDYRQAYHLLNIPKQLRLRISTSVLPLQPCNRLPLNISDFIHTMYNRCPSTVEEGRREEPATRLRANDSAKEKRQR